MLTMTALIKILIHLCSPWCEWYVLSGTISTPYHRFTVIKRDSIISFFSFLDSTNIYAILKLYIYTFSSFLQCKKLCYSLFWKIFSSIMLFFSNCVLKHRFMYVRREKSTSPPHLWGLDYITPYQTVYITP
jgi:hypothetical protein